MFFVVEPWSPGCESSRVIRLNNVSPYGTIAAQSAPGIDVKDTGQNANRTAAASTVVAFYSLFFCPVAEMFPFQDLKYDITLTSMLFTYAPRERFYVSYIISITYVTRRVYVLQRLLKNEEKKDTSILCLLMFASEKWKSTQRYMSFQVARLVFQEPSCMITR